MPLHRTGARFLPSQERRGKGTHKGCPYAGQGARFLPSQERRGKGTHKGCPYAGQGARFLPSQERRGKGTHKRCPYTGQGARFPLSRDGFDRLTMSGEGHPTMSGEGLLGVVAEVFDVGGDAGVYVVFGGVADVFADAGEVHDGVVGV